MAKLKKLEKKLKQYQKRYQKLLKMTALEGPRYGRSSDEFLDTQIRVVESMIIEIKDEIRRLKKSS